MRTRVVSRGNTICDAESTEHVIIVAMRTPTETGTAISAGI